jgi:polyhydroxyalkanoate synthase subunit PhaC
MMQDERPDRRLAPRPLPAHLSSAAGLWLSSRIALPFLKSVSPRSNKAASTAAVRLRALAGEIGGFGPDRVAGALDAEIARRAEAYVAGLDAYRRHPYRRPAATAPAVWREGATQLLDYGHGAAAPAVLVVPSLVNRYYVLDLLPERSFLRHLARRGLRPLVVDWGSPGAAEAGLDLAGYTDRLDRAFAVVAQSARKPLAVLGYCMGGLLALAVALRRQRQLTGLALLATPWNFHAERVAQTRLLGLLGDCLPAPATFAGTVPVEIVQSLFFLVDPFLAERKFVRFARIDPAAEEASGFVALEDWINDGVPLPLAVARECLCSWYGDNAPGRGSWRVGGRAVRPELLRRPALVVIPARDRIVPPASAEALAAAIPHAEVLRAPLGHVGMMSGARAPDMLWTPIARWLAARLGQP